MKNISILGLGNISFELCSALINKGFNVFGSTDNYDRQVILKKIGVKVFSRRNIGQCILKADKLIITVPPDNFGCKIIKTYSKEILDSNVKWIGYLSSTSVYGNYNGEEVNEKSKLRPKESLEKNRVKAEQDLLDFGTKYSIVNFLTLSFFITFTKIIIKDTNWAIIVAIAIPLTPIAGMKRKPKIKIGFKIILRKKDKTRIFR